MSETHEVIRSAAFRLFEERGYDATSVDDIAAEARVSRSTFFRAFGMKEAVVFPDHDLLLRQVEQRLQEAGQGSALTAVTDAVKVVLAHYVSEGERAQERYRLTSTVSALRERELISSARYQHLFRRHLSRWGSGSADDELRAELMAAAVVAAHNRVLRRWLRGDTSDPTREVEGALAVVHDVFDDTQTVGPAAVVVMPASADMTRVEAAVRRALSADRIDGQD